MTKQEIFNGTVERLAAQGWAKSVTLLRGVCMYRGPNNTVCAIGAHITDEEYKPEFECNGIDTLRRLQRVRIKALTGIPTAWLVALQDVHDLNYTPAQMIEGFRAFAAEHDLTIPQVLA